MPLSSKSPPKWRRVNLSTNGKVTTVRCSTMKAIDLVDLFYSALEEIPHAAKAMELALEKYKNINDGK